MLAASGMFEIVALLLMAPIICQTGSIPLPTPLESLFNLSSHLSGWLSTIEGQLAFVVAVGFLSQSAKFASSRQTAKLRCDFEERMRRRLLGNLFEMPWEAFHTMKAGGVQNNLLVSVWYVGETLERIVFSLGTSLIIGALTLSALLVSASMTSVVIGFGLVMMLTVRTLSRKAQPWIRRLSADSQRVAERTAHVMDNLKFIRSSGFLGSFRASMFDDIGKTRLNMLKQSKYAETNRFLVDGGGIILLSVIVYMNRRSAALDVGTFLTFIGLLYRIIPRLGALQVALFSINTATGWVTSWFTALHETEPRLTGRTSAASDTPSFTREVRFADVGYSYDTKSTSDPTFVVSGVTVSLKKGSFIAIVGESGSGKTTVMDLALGLIQPTVGTIFVDDRPLNEINLDNWRRRIGFVPQDAQLFYGTVLENVAFGDPSPDRALAEVCLRQAEAWSVVEGLPAGLDTVVGERGARLSGGQRQRLGIARALYREPDLLLLDEPTSALDEASAERIHQVLRSMKGDFTIVLITHNPNLVAMADQVWALDRGNLRVQRPTSARGQRPSDTPSLPAAGS